ncbi:hypothetical protein SY2F82_43100 [Streptomyces sp. Y2F8-2]|nr:hypothetical protein SY2F82_43100 [Streptomyces sp. Y2F8-2]
MRGLTGGVLSLTAYALAVWAQDHGDLASIAALRETSIVIAALLGTVLFRERLGGRRLAASVTVVFGHLLPRATVEFSSGCGRRNVRVWVSTNTFCSSARVTRSPSP